jgi:hypothetical protein
MNAADRPHDAQDWHPREVQEILANFAAEQDRPKGFVDAATAIYLTGDDHAIDTLCERAIARGLDKDVVQLLLVEAMGRAVNAPRKPNGGIHQDARGNLRQTPEQKKQPFDWRKGATSGKEIRTMIFNPVTFLVRDLIPNEGVTLICSKPKVGKSWLVLDIAIASTMDRHVLGDIKPEQGDVLYLALEDSLRRLQSRMTKLLPTFAGEWPEGITFHTQWRRVDQGGLDDIREWATETKAHGRKIAFIAIDVLKKVRPPSKPGQPPYESDYEAIGGLQRLGIELAVPIIVIHHTRKAEADDLIDKVSGTAGLTGAVDTIIVIERQSQGAVFDVRGRDVEANTFAVDFSKDTCRWTILGSAEAVQRSSERARILEIFAEATGPLSPKTVTDLVNCDSHPKHLSHDAVRQLLVRMAKNRALTRLETGKYTLPGTLKGDESHRHSSHSDRDM